MTKKVKFIVFLVLFIVGAFFYFSGSSGLVLSDSQVEIVESLGRPDQFMIAYLPQGDSDLVRSETWFYLEVKEELSFLAGELVETKEIEQDLSGRSSTDLKSEDFDFYVSFEEVDAMFDDSLVSVQAPVFFDEENGLETYACSEALFVFERGYLTYVETLD